MTTERGNGARYEMLPREERPSYTSRADLRLVARAVRNGWMKDVPDERIAEWFEDVARMLGKNTGSSKQLAALRVCVKINSLVSDRQCARLEAAMERLRQEISGSAEGFHGLESTEEL